jgi:hypothetical protein
MVALMVILLQTLPSSDQTLKPIFDHETTPGYTESSLQKIGMGDEWVAAAKKLPSFRVQLYDRASEWYVKAWPDLDPFWKTRAREQGARMAASRSPGVSGKRLPSGWNSSMGAAFLDGTVARTGSYSIRIPGGKGETYFGSDPIPLTGKTVEVSVWVRSDGTDSHNDVITIYLLDKNKRGLDSDRFNAPMDTPFWVRVTGKKDAIRDAAFVGVGVAVRSGSGNVWLDDYSMKIDGKEVLKNPSFEER